MSYKHGGQIPPGDHKINVMGHKMIKWIKKILLHQTIFFWSKFYFFSWKILNILDKRSQINIGSFWEATSQMHVESMVCTVVEFIVLNKSNYIDFPEWPLFIRRWLSPRNGPGVTSRVFWGWFKVKWGGGGWGLNFGDGQEKRDAHSRWRASFFGDVHWELERSLSIPLEARDR